LQGTVAAADANNMKFVASGAAVIPSFEYPAVVGNYQMPVFTFTSDGVTATTLKAIGAATAGTIYGGDITITAVSAPFTLQLGDRVWNLTLPATGILTIGCEPMTLERTDPRILSSSIAGAWSLEIIGFGDVRKRRY
jgi:hypothetical protein